MRGQLIDTFISYVPPKDKCILALLRGKKIKLTVEGEEGLWDLYAMKTTEDRSQNTFYGRGPVLAGMVQRFELRHCAIRKQDSSFAVSPPIQLAEVTKDPISIPLSEITSSPLVKIPTLLDIFAAIKFAEELVEFPLAGANHRATVSYLRHHPAINADMFWVGGRVPRKSGNMKCYLALLDFSRKRGWMRFVQDRILEESR